MVAVATSARRPGHPIEHRVGGEGLEQLEVALTGRVDARQEHVDDANRRRRPDPPPGETDAAAKKIAAELQELGIEVLVDDRDERPGVKFKDADLLGAPLRLTVGGRGLANGTIETKERSTGEQKDVALDEIASWAAAWVKERRG